MNKLKKILLDGLDLSTKGQLDDALSKWKEGLTEEPRKGDKLYVRMLHKIMSVTYEQRGETFKAKRSFLKSMQFLKKPGPCDYYWLGILSSRLGQLRATDRYFTRCEQLALLEREEYEWLLEILEKMKGDPTN